jgi:hypothetical protein
MAVVRSTRPTNLIVEIVPARENGSLAATIRLEAVSQSATVGTGAPVMATEPAGDVAKLDLQHFKLVAHVAGIGDVTARADEWIAGPSFPSRVEGFAIEWSEKPPGIEIGYSARIGGPNPMSTGTVNIGTFIGTKGRALPLVGAEFELSGLQAKDYQLSVEYLFLASPKVKQSGSRLTLSGPTGREPLVGLRVGLGRTRQAESVPPQTTAPKRSSRVRVFRSSSRHGA